MHWLLHLLLALIAVSFALLLRPWRSLPLGGPPWPWLAWAVTVMPLLWSADRMAQSAVVQPLSGACLLLLMAGWPLAVLGLVPVSLMTAWLADLSFVEALQRGVWLGLLPATLAMALGAGVRRWMPHHLMVYILCRGFFATLLAGTLAGAAALGAHGGMATLSDADLMLGRWLSAWGDAFITGMFTAIFVAFRPQWLATYSDRLYLPR
jgi:uncharacterized membrane protein